MTDTDTVERIKDALYDCVDEGTFEWGVNQDQILGDMARAIAALPPAVPPTTPDPVSEAAKVRPEAVEALAAYQQADMDGIMVLASRQAIEECLPALRALTKDGEAG